MFTFDSAEDPFLRMSLTGAVTPEDERDYLEVLALLEERQSRFGLISVIDIESGEVSHDTRREQAVWFKRNREHLAKFCIGLVRVRPQIDPAESDENFIRAMPFPTQRVLREDQALPLLHAWSEAAGDAPGGGKKT